MRVRRIVLAVVMVAAAIAAALPVSAQEGLPVVEEPVLRPDSQFEATAWGYKKKILVFPPAPSGLATVLTMEGYGGAGVPNAYLRMADGKLMALRFQFGQGPRGDYVRVNASIRGTECSGGSFNLYDRRHAWDGHAIVEFLGTQAWSNGNVGMIGHSFSGQTAYWTAATQPPHLKAVSPNLLHSDIYRDIFMPGAVQNYLFPVIWYLGTPVGGPHRAPYSSLQNGNIPNDEICTQHQVSRYSAKDPPNVFREYLYHAVEETDNDWYQMHAAAVHAPAIRIPYMQQNNWQDEQTGPRAATLYNYIKPDPLTINDRNGVAHTVVPKKMLFSNGSHGYGGAASRRQWDFFDIFLYGRNDAAGLFDDADGDAIADATVENFFEIRGSGDLSGQWSWRKTGETWPFAGTRWARFYPNNESGLLGVGGPGDEETTRTYISGAATRNWSRPGMGDAVPPQTTTARGLPDALVYETQAMAEDLPVAGPILFTMHASMAGTDADFFVSLYDVDLDGNVSYLQRGLLKASHHAVDQNRSFYSDDFGSRILVQPYRPHTNPQIVTPGEVVRYDIEVWPVGHIFRAGHSIRLQISTPPALDGLWGYTATHHQPSVVNLHQSRVHTTELLLPVVDGLERGTAPEATSCPVPGGFPCVPGSSL